MEFSERRKFTRAPFETEIRVTADEGIVVSNRLRDISLGGAYIYSERSPKEGSPCTLVIDLIGPRTLLRIEVEGDVVRCEDQGMAVKFTQIDVDSLIHLRHLIQVHAKAPEVIALEFAEKLLAVKGVP